MDRFEILKDIGSGNFGVAKLVRDKWSGELYAVKYIQRGHKARYFFQQLISGVSYCHSMQICHRDLKLENTLLDGSKAPRLKICDFGYSKSSVLHSQPKSTVGTPAYIAPEVLSRKEYDGKVSRPRGSKKLQNDNSGYVRVSLECRHLLSRIFVADPEKRITIPEIQKHPWFLKNLPIEFMEEDEGSMQKGDENDQSQSIEEILGIIQEARKPGEGPKFGGQCLIGGSMDLDDLDTDADTDDIETSGDFVCAL
ncbi:hypothetical protein CUMW_038900 [Citrus unshiu]|nr:hypothetical protein CUMW_038900 [Citrus unshiu]